MHTLDTSIYNFEKHSYADITDYHYQNLGNFGTALYSVFRKPQEQIGRTSGFNAFRPYFTKPEEIKFYDTKSPLIELFGYLGGQNRNRVNILFSRNITENWNFGFDYRSITSDKQIARTSEGDRNVEMVNFDLYTFYKAPKKKYQLLASYASNVHNAVEIGGVRYGADSLLSEYFLFRNSLTRLEDATNEMVNTRINLYHDYQLSSEFQLYHQFDYERDVFTYQDYTDGSSTGYNTYLDFYPNFFIDADSTWERSTFRSVTNEAGLKGNLSRLYYRAYAKVRWVDFDYFLLDPLQPTVEQYLGGLVRFNWKNKFDVEGEGEYLLGGGYKLSGKLNSDIINLQYDVKRYNAPIVFNQYFGNHFEWSNNFDPVLYNEILGDIRFTYRFVELIPRVRLASYTNFLYFDEHINPVQANNSNVISSVGGDINFRLINRKGESLNLENEVIYSTTVGDSRDALRVPPLFYNGKLFWDGKLFKDRVPVQVGANMHAQSSYFGYAYQPAIQQHYLENDQDIFGYFKTDVFFNMRLDKFFISIKWVHLDEAGGEGYFTTTYYPGQTRSMDLIVRWLFFD